MDDPTSLQAQIAELRTLTEENNRILKAMRRDALIGGIVKTLIWVLLIVGSYYLTMQFLEPYFGMLEGMQGGDGQDWSALLEQYRAMTGQY